MAEISESVSFKLKDGLLVEVEDRSSIKHSQLVVDQREDVDEIEIDLCEWMTPPESPDASSHESCTLDGNGSCLKPGHNSQCKHSLYGKPLDAKRIIEIMTSEDTKVDIGKGGLIWRATVIPNDFDAQYQKNKSLKMITPNHYDAKNKCIKPRRGNLIVTETDFFSSLTRVDIEGEKHCRWVFTGVLNGWPGLQCLELLNIMYQGPIPAAWLEHWRKQDDTKPTYPKMPLISEVSVTLREPSWSAHGWTKESPGYLFWYESPASREVPRIIYGTDITKTFEKERIGVASPKCVKVHMVSHRYSLGNSETVKDKLTYHSLALLEWDHGQYSTVVEIGFLNGLAGSYGRSNWFEDKNEEVTSLFKCIPPEMVAPWRQNLSEIRCTDVEPSSLEEFLTNMKKHTGKDKRFLDVHHSFSHDVRLSFNSREHIAEYLLNYARRDRTYSEMSRNCQTFAADFCAFLAGKKNVQPFHIVNRIDYRNHAYHFLYDMKSP